MKNQDEKDPQFAYTLAKGLAVLRAFDGSSPFLSNSEIARRTGLTRPTVARLTRTLGMLGYLVYRSSDARYRLSVSALSFGYPLLSQLSVRQLARAHMQELANFARGAVSIGMRSGTEMILVESCVDNTAPHAKPDVGAVRGITSTAMGLTYYSAIPDTERQALDKALEAENKSEWTKTRAIRAKAIRQMAEYGYCRHATVEHGLEGIAVPMRSNFDGELLVVNCVVASFYAKGQWLEKEIGPRLKHLVRHVEESAGLRRSS